MQKTGVRKRVTDVSAFAKLATVKAACTLITVAVQMRSAKSMMSADYLTLQQ